MRTTKPNCLSVLTRCFEHRRAHYFGLSVFALAPLRGPPRLYSEQSLWGLLPKAAPEFTEAGIPKGRSEFLLYGAAYAPAGPVTASLVFGVRFAGLAWSARAFGPRLARGDALIHQAPLQRVPLEWSNVYGGPTYAPNPRGTGHASSLREDGLILLPSLEPLDCPWHPTPEQNRPLMIGTLDPGHPQRLAHAGTYDGDWLKTDFPGLAKDADWTYFNVAPPEQRRTTPEPFVGDEGYELFHLSAGEPRLGGQLPGIRARAFVQRQSAEGTLEEVGMALRTVVFLPDHDRIVLIWQGFCRTDEDDAQDIAGVLAAAEALDRPRGIDHYLAAVKARTEDEDAMLRALDDTPLLPEGLLFEGLIPEDLDLNRPPSSDSYEARLRRRGERQMQSARAEVERQGLDPEEHAPPARLPPAPGLPPLPQLGELMRQIERESTQRMAEAKAKNAAMLDRLEQEFQQRGESFEPIRRELSGEDLGGPPQPLFPQHMKTLEGIQATAQAQQVQIPEVDGMLGDEALHILWRQTDQQVLGSYFANAHFMNPAAPSQGETAARQQSQVAERLAQRQGLQGLDLTGADLRQLDLRGCDCSGAMLEAADLRGMDLAGARFYGAVLARARLAGANLRDCDFSQANLSKADLEGADAAGASFAEANLWEARLSRAHLREARFLGAQFFGAGLAGVDLSGADLTGAQFLEVDLTGAAFDRARLDEAQFISCKLGSSRWCACQGGEVVFFNLECPGVDFTGAVLPKSRWVGTINLSGANFAKATLTHAYFAQGSRLHSVNLAAAIAQHIDLTACDLEGAFLRLADLRTASLRRANLQGADLSGANLMEACLLNARVYGARLVGCNLYAADLARLRLDTQTRFDASLTTRARTYPRWRPPGGTG